MRSVWIIFEKLSGVSLLVLLVRIGVIAKRYQIFTLGNRSVAWIALNARVNKLCLFPWVQKAKIPNSVLETVKRDKPV